MYDVNLWGQFTKGCMINVTSRAREGSERLCNILHSHPVGSFKGTSSPLFQVNMKETFSHPEQTIITPLTFSDFSWKIPKRGNIYTNKASMSIVFANYLNLWKKPCSNKFKYLKVLRKMFRAQLKTLDKVPWRDIAWN